MRALVVGNPIPALRGFLKSAGFRVFGAPNGPEAIQVLEDQGPIDLVLVDWSLPRWESVRFVQRVRSLRIYNSMRLIMLTTALDAAQVLDAVRLGVDECLVQPFTQEGVLEMLTRLGAGKV